MTIKVKLESGEEIDTFTQEELEAKQAEALESYKSENPDKTEELTALQEELRVANDKLGKVDDKNVNFVALRKAKEDAEKKVDEILKGVDGKIEQVKKEVLEGVMQDHKQDTLKSLSGGDAELEKKIEFHYKRLGDVASTKQEISKKLNDAWVLATAKESDGMTANIYGSGNVGRVNINNTSPKFSAEEKELGSKFGLTDKDFGK